jgi:hypothetical protein
VDEIDFDNAKKAVVAADKAWDEHPVFEGTRPINPYFIEGFLWGVEWAKQEYEEQLGREELKRSIRCGKEK